MEDSNKIYLFNEKSLKNISFLYKAQSYNEYSLLLVILVTIISGFDRWSIICFIFCISCEFFISFKIINEKESSSKSFLKFVSMFTEIINKNKIN